MTVAERRKVIWADDDNRFSLKILRGLLERRGLLIKDFSDFDNAKSFIDGLYVDGEVMGEISLLVDVILPKDSTGRAASPYIGMELAELACRAGIGGVCFLTVINDPDSLGRLAKLRGACPEIPIQVFDKLRLIEDGMVDKLASFLRQPRASRS